MWVSNLGYIACTKTATKTTAVYFSSFVIASASPPKLQCARRLQPPSTPTRVCIQCHCVSRFIFSTPHVYQTPHAPKPHPKSVAGINGLPSLTRNRMVTALQSSKASCLCQCRPSSQYIPHRPSTAPSPDPHRLPTEMILLGGAAIPHVASQQASGSRQ